MTINPVRVTATEMSVTINNNELLSPSSLAIEPGSWVGIVGPNGGGKSTFVKALMGQVPHQGVIAFEWLSKRIGNIGYVPQVAPFEASLPITVLDYMRMVCEQKPVWFKYKNNKKITQGMDKFNIAQFANKRLGTLSTGERQRVLLCSALLNDPDVLVLDEPLAGVDKQGHQMILDILQSYKDSNRTIIMVEHHWHVIEKHCDKVALIDGGLVQYGEVESVFNTMQASFTPFELAKSA